GAHQPDEIIGVGERDAAFAARHRPDLVGVTAFRTARHVVDHPLEPGHGLLQAMVLDHRAEQRQVVGVASRTGADLALVRRIRQRLVGLYALGVYVLLVVNDDPGAIGEPEPGVVA